MKRGSFIPESGERGIVMGQTGSGKTAFVIWLLVRIPTAPIIIYDTKLEPKFEKLPASKVVVTQDEVAEAFKDVKLDYIIVRPPEALLGEPEKLDEYLWYHYLHFHQSVAYIDEATTFHTMGGKPFKGLLSLMTRGRSKGITTIISSQRPRGISRSVITEATKAYVFYLADMDDRKRISDVIPNFYKYPLPKKHAFYFFESGEDRAILYEPIKLDPAMDTGYTDAPAVNTTEVKAETVEAEEKTATKHVWV